MNAHRFTAALAADTENRISLYRLRGGGLVEPPPSPISDGLAGYARACRSRTPLYAGRAWSCLSKDGSVRQRSAEGGSSTSLPANPLAMKSSCARTISARG